MAWETDRLGIRGLIRFYEVTRVNETPKQKQKKFNV